MSKRETHTFWINFENLKVPFVPTQNRNLIENVKLKMIKNLSI